MFDYVLTMSLAELKGFSYEAEAHLGKSTARYSTTQWLSTCDALARNNHRSNPPRHCRHVQLIKHTPCMQEPQQRQAGEQGKNSIRRSRLSGVSGPRVAQVVDPVLKPAGPARPERPTRTAVSARRREPQPRAAAEVPQAATTDRRSSASEEPRHASVNRAGAGPSAASAGDSGGQTSDDVDIMDDATGALVVMRIQ